MKALVVGLLAAAAVSAGQGRQAAFTGTITDSMCAREGHAAMRMGPTDGECAVACVLAHGAEYVLSDGKQVYTLSDQQAPEKFAGQRVRVVGTLDADARTIQVESITPAE